MRAFYAFLIAIAVLWAVLRNARAQLYVSSRPEGGLFGVVSEYNATTGEVIRANLITGLSVPRALAVSGNKLFVANTVSGTVSEYDATTGEVIKANFITGLSNPEGIAVKSAK